MNRLRRLAALGIASAGLMLGSGCTTTSLLLSAVGASTDTSVTWSVIKHLHEQMTEGDARPCSLLNSVQRALSGRCGAFVPGSIVAADLERTGLSECALTLAARDPHLWPALPEMLDKGARVEACTESPMVALAQRLPCPDFGSASAESRRALAQLAETDARAIHHDAVRMLSCPAARSVGLDGVIATWRARGSMKPETLGFSPLGALDPDALSSPLARDLEADGHTARAALGGYDGVLRPGFEEALRTSHWAALEWWLQRLPELARRVPPTQGNQLTWLPLARVLVPSFLAHPESQKDMVAFLLARGADPRQRLPSNPDQSVLAFARLLKSPALPLLDPPPVVTASERFAAAPKTTQPAE
ncbi:MAG TPA: hypothetical protein VF319_15080 [Caldimonas sp.]